MEGKKRGKKPTYNKNKETEIKAVIFDVGGVLALSKSSDFSYNDEARTTGVHKYISKKLGLDLDVWFDTIEPFHDSVVRGKISRKEVIKKISQRTGISKEKLEKIIHKAYKKNFEQNKRLYKKAFKLKKQGYKIAILSDQWPLAREIVMKPKYTKKFDVSVVSYEVKSRKPDIEIYKLTLKKLKLKPEETVFIDNHEWNLKPARKLGMDTILFKNNEQCLKELNKLLNKNKPRK